MPDHTPAVNRTPTTGLFVKLDTGWVDNPKLIRAGLDGAGLHATALCIAKRLNTDGWIDRLLLVRYGASDDLIERLVDLGLLDDDEDRVRPSGWLDRNPSQGAIDAMRASKSDGGKRGNHKRWNHSGPFATCSLCHETPTSSQGATGVRSDTDRYRSPETDTERESESAPTSTITTTEVVEPPAPATVDEQAIRKTAVAIGRAEAWTDPAGVGNPEAFASTVTRRLLTDPARQAERDRIRHELAAGRTPEQIAAGWRTTTGPVISADEQEQIRQKARQAEQATRARLEVNAAAPHDPDAGLAAVRAIRESRKQATA
jgi:hypothetical protein